MPTGKPGTGRPRPHDKGRKHVATGNPNGGARPGAGRPPGIPGLPTSSIPAIESLKMRVPDDASEDQKVLLKKTEEAIVKVMEGKVHGSIASAVLLAARTAREEICGPMTKKVEVEAKLGIGKLLDEVKTIEQEEQAALPPPPPKALPVARGPIIRKKAAESVLSLAVEAASETEEWDLDGEVKKANGDTVQ